MIKKVLLLFVFTAVSLFAMNFQTASKEELMSIKGIGEKRAAAIMKYRKTHKIKSAADLKNVPGIGDEIADNAKRGIKNADKKVTKAKKTTKSVKRTAAKTKAVKEKVSKKKTAIKEKTAQKAKKSKTKATKKVKKVAGDKTKRAEKRAKTKVKKSLKKVKEKKKK
jgi:competence protein ComEA